MTARPGIYFFLSYAHSVVAAGRTGSDADPSVSRFFADLRRSVTKYACPRPDMQIAFFDQDIPITSNLKAELSKALSLAEVFVPLYSPGYFANAWPMREQEVFLGRLGNLPGGDPGHHIVPVLWTPFPSWQSKPAGVDEAVGLGADIPGYSENGLRALCMLATYRPSYNDILERLAHRVVSLVERSAVGPSPAPDLDDVPGQVVSEAAFGVAVLGPQQGPGSLLGRVGSDPDSRRPFADRNAPSIAQYVASVAERLGFQTRILDPRRVTELARSPAIVIVDPRIVSEDDGAGRLGETFNGLPDWVLPLVVADEDDPAYSRFGPDMRAETLGVLRNLGRPAVDSTRNMEDFRDALPRVVSKARRTYLKKAQEDPLSGTARPDPAPEGDRGAGS